MIIEDVSAEESLVVGQSYFFTRNRQRDDPFPPNVRIDRLAAFGESAFNDGLDPMLAKREE